MLIWIEKKVDLHEKKIWNMNSLGGPVGEGGTAAKYTRRGKWMEKYNARGPPFLWRTVEGESGGRTRNFRQSFNSETCHTWIIFTHCRWIQYRIENSSVANLSEKCHYKPNWSCRFRHNFMYEGPNSWALEPIYFLLNCLLLYETASG